MPQESDPNLCIHDNGDLRPEMTPEIQQDMELLDIGSDIQSDQMESQGCSQPGTNLQII